MNKEEIAKLFKDMEYFVDDDFGGHYESVVGNCEASNTFSYMKIRDYILDLQSQLDIANKKLEEIKEYCKNKNDDLTMIGIPFIETEFSHILSIIGGNNE